VFYTAHGSLREPYLSFFNNCLSSLSKMRFFVFSITALLAATGVFATSFTPTTTRAPGSPPAFTPVWRLKRRDPSVCDDISDPEKNIGNDVRNFLQVTTNLVEDASGGIVGDCDLVRCGKALGHPVLTCVAALANGGILAISDLVCLTQVSRCRLCWYIVGNLAA